MICGASIESSFAHTLVTTFTTRTPRSSAIGRARFGDAGADRGAPLRREGRELLSGEAVLAGALEHVLETLGRVEAPSLPSLDAHDSRRGAAQGDLARRGGRIEIAPRRLATPARRTPSSYSSKNGARGLACRRASRQRRRSLTACVRSGAFVVAAEVVRGRQGVRPRRCDRLQSSDRARDHPPGASKRRGRGRRCPGRGRSRPPRAAFARRDRRLQRVHGRERGERVRSNGGATIGEHRQARAIRRRARG